jgi:NAD(P)-dependent dehydrogenase (short-subunit alcohol dehydrogenase family)
MKEFKDKVAVITGAASGIGRGIAERCVGEGMRVVLADINEEDLHKAETETRDLGGTVLSVRTDVTKRNDLELLARKTLDAFGEVHLLVNNAGVGAGGPPWEATWSDWEWVISVNLWGVIHGVKVFTPIMLAQKTDCHIVNTASLAGLMVGGAIAPYSVTKHAVVALSESLYLALEARNALVKVSVLCPGFVKTNIMNAERNRPVELQNEPVEISPQVQAYLDFMNAAIDAGMSPLQVADQVFQAIKEERFYILTHPEWLPVIKLRVDNLLRVANPQNPVETIMQILQSKV